MNLTLTADSVARKNIPIDSGCIRYFPAAIAGVAMHSKISNDKHNPGEPMHHSRGKSNDHADCIDRHKLDINDMLAVMARELPSDVQVKALLTEANALAWRALAWSQELHERYGGAPLAPAARLPEPEVALTDFDRVCPDPMPPALKLGPLPVSLVYCTGGPDCPCGCGC